MAHGLSCPWHVGSSWTRTRTHFPGIGRWILNHGSTREVPIQLFISINCLPYSVLHLLVTISRVILKVLNSLQNPPPGYVGPWGHRRKAGEIRRGRWEGPSRRSWRGAEGDCPAHVDTGSPLSSQAGPLPSKGPPSPTPTPHAHWSWGHRTEAQEIRRGR